MRNLISKTLIIFLSLVFFSNLSIAQPKNIKGKISGTVVDAKSNSPLASATIQVFNIKDSSLATGGTSEANGDFLITDIPAGAYFLKVSYIGYNTAVIKNIMITGKNPDINLGTIKLEVSSEVTEEIEVTSEVPVMKMEFEKKVYDVKKTIIAESGTAIDVLKNIPSVTVDNDGNVSIRGSQNVRILIDGKPSGLQTGDNATILEQIPANNIERIEIINNPSAKYEAEGMAGIINIILKKSPESVGYNGNINLNAGTQDKYSTSLGFNYKKNEFGISLNYSFRSFRMLGVGDGLRYNYFNDSLYLLDQSIDFNNKMQSHFGTLGFDYDVSKKTNLNLTINIDTRNRKRNEYNFSKTSDINKNLQQVFSTSSLNEMLGKHFESTLNFKTSFSKPKQELTSSLNFSYHEHKNDVDFSKQDYTTNITPIPNPFLEHDISKDITKLLTFQIDYTHPLSEDVKLDFGYKLNARKMDNNMQYETYNYSTSQWVYDLTRSNEFLYNDYINALYGVFAYKYKDFGVQGGIRLEHTTNDFKLSNSNKTYKTDYLDFFPSLNLTQKLGNTNEFQIGYARRINRPRAWDLNPFVDYSDPLNLRTGNPELKPEYIHSFETSYIKYLPFASITTSVFYKRASDVINRFGYIDSNGVSTMTFKNIAKSNSYGFELIFQGAIQKWWTAIGSFSYFRTDISGNDGYRDITNSSYSWTAKLLSSISIKNWFDLQFAYNYFGKMVMLQGSMEPLQSLDIAVKKDFFNKRFSVMFRVADVFKTSEFKFTTNGTGFSSNFSRNRDSRIAFLTLTYKFGTDIKDSKKSRRKGNENNDDEREMEF
ncbi:MAG: TonB-dependent receptor [Ignavibacteria bacterium]|nr:TonB-dependent receptor [Ignavibacteria bacterium]